MIRSNLVIYEETLLAISYRSLPIPHVVSSCRISTKKHVDFGHLFSAWILMPSPEHAKPNYLDKPFTAVKAVCMPGIVATAKHVF